MFTTLFIKDYADHGDYWRGDYETTDEPKYSYTRDQVMEDARRIYKEVSPEKRLSSLIQNLKNTFWLGPGLSNSRILWCSRSYLYTKSFMLMWEPDCKMSIRVTSPQMLLFLHTFLVIYEAWLTLPVWLYFRDQHFPKNILIEKIHFGLFIQVTCGDGFGPICILSPSHSLISPTLMWALQWWPR